MTTTKPAKTKKAATKPPASAKAGKAKTAKAAAKLSAEATPAVKPAAKTKAPKSGAAKAPRSTVKTSAAPGRAGAALRQVAALPLRRTAEGALQVLLITSRETHRWVIPKGWPMKRKTGSQAAAIEAQEEGGLLGDIAAEPLGAYAYFKRREEHFDLVDVAVYRLDVSGQNDEWLEKDQREQRWCDLEEAAALVQEPGLKALLEDLAERL